MFIVVSVLIYTHIRTNLRTCMYVHSHKQNKHIRILDTYLGHSEMVDILRTTFPGHFLERKFWNFHWKSTCLFVMLLTSSQYWCRTKYVTYHYLNRRWYRHISCITQYDRMEVQIMKKFLSKQIQQIYCHLILSYCAINLAQYWHM